MKVYTDIQVYVQVNNGLYIDVLRGKTVFIVNVNIIKTQLLKINQTNRVCFCHSVVVQEQRGHRYKLVDVSHQITSSYFHCSAL